MSIILQSRNCIDKYLGKYEILLETCEINEGNGIINGKMTLHTKSKKKLAIIEYYLSLNELFITNVQKYDKMLNVHNIPIKSTKIFLLYLLALYSDNVKYVKLISSPPTDYKVNKDFCLACYYQELGFTPEPYDTIEHDHIVYLINECIRRKIVKNTDKLLSMCLLCKCQEEIVSKNIDLNGLVINDIQVFMEGLIPNLKDALKKEFNEMNC